MSTVSANYAWLAPNPKSSYRQLFVKGTRIPARALYGWYACDEPRTPEEIAADYELPVEAVKEAITYCQSDPPELRQDYARDQALMEAAGMLEPGYRYRGEPRRLSPEEWAKLNAT
jgi:uncharacterized protein (DUF433 family)